MCDIIFDSILILQHLYTSAYNTVALQEVSWSRDCLSFFMWLQTDWWWSDLISRITGWLQLMAKLMFGNVNWYFLLIQIEITDLKPFGHHYMLNKIINTTLLHLKHLDMPHLWGGWLSRSLTQIYTDLWTIFERNRPFMYVEKVFNLWVQLMKNGSKMLIILFSVFHCNKDTLK